MLKIPKGPFDIIVADPPWSYETWSKKGQGRSASQHYRTMSLGWIKALEIPAARKSLLFLWVTSPFLEKGLEIMRAWGFPYSSSIVWDKQKIGTGYWVRNQHELVLIGRRGGFNCPPPAMRRSSVIARRRTEHSEKPADLQIWIDKVWPKARKLEIFARRRRNKWSSWGDEL